MEGSVYKPRNAEDFQQPPEAGGGREGPLWGLWKDLDARLLAVGTVLSHSVCGICYNGPRKLIHHIKNKTVNIDYPRV